MYQKMMDKEFGIKAIAFIFSVSVELIKKLLMKAQKMHLMLAYKQDQSKRENLHQWYNRKRMIQRQRKAKENGK